MSRNNAHVIPRRTETVVADGKQSQTCRANFCPPYQSRIGRR